MARMAGGDRAYHGRWIRPCESADRGPYTRHKGNWIVQSYCHGMQEWDELCYHGATLADVKAYIDRERGDEVS